MSWFWVAMTAACFALGFALSWIQMRKRVMRRYEQALEQEVKRRVQEEVLRRITQGPELRERVKQAMDEQSGETPGARQKQAGPE